MATIPNPQITPIPNNEPDATPNLWNTRYVEIDANFSNLDDRAKAVELELSNSKGTYASLPAAISTIDDRVAKVEASISGADTFSIAKIKQATHLDWAYRNDRISFEFFTPDYTLIDKAPTAVTGGILGDDSLDVVSTDGIVAGGYYVLSDAGNDIHILNDAVNTTMIRVKAILSSQRLRLYDSLDRHWINATVSQHNFAIDATTSFATAPVGSMWMSKLINIGNKNGKLVIRRSANAAIVKAFYQAEGDSSWTETTPTNRITQVIDGVPAGFVDVEYQVPISENIRLRLEVSGETVEIHHIVAFGLQYLESMNQAIADLVISQIHLEQKANVHHLASTLDWAYRFDRMNFEFFAPEYTLINKSAISIREAAVQGDNTIDVGDTSQFVAGDYYVLYDDTHTKLIKVAAIHTDNILTIEGVLDRRWDKADTKVSKCNFDILGGNNAVANDGEMWVSKPITLSTDALDGFAVIRRTHNTAQVKLWWMDAGLVWTESVGSLRQIGNGDNKDGVPVGFADYEFALPFTGEGRIRIEVIDEPQPVNGVLTPNTRPITIQHIVAIGLFNAIGAANDAIDSLGVRQAATESKTALLDSRQDVSELATDSLLSRVNVAEIDIDSLDSRQTNTEIKANKLQLASELDWGYRFDRMNFEFFTPDYTLIDKPVVSIREAAPVGTNLLDVGDASTFEVGDFYILSDSTHSAITGKANTKLIQVASIHTDNIITIVGKLDRRWDVNSKVSKCNLKVLGTNEAIGNDGEMWISKLIEVSGNSLDGSVIIRRTHNETQIKLWWQGNGDASWVESLATVRHIGGSYNIDSVPVGFADYEYAMPFSGQGKIRIEIVDEPVLVNGTPTYNTRPITISHIAAVGLFNAIDSLGSRVTVAEGDIDVLDTRQTATEVIVDKHHYASKLDWVYRFDRMNYEFFTPDYTLIYKPALTVREAAVVGDDTLDVGDTSSLEVGDWYVLSDSTHNVITGKINTALIQIKEIHTDNIIRIEGTFARRWDIDSALSKCNLKVMGTNEAIGNDGEMYISRPIAISTDALDGFVMIRRTHNDAQIRVWWMDATHTAWQESSAELRTVGDIYDIDGVPLGFADYKYQMPMSGVGKFMIEIVDPPVLINNALVYNTRPITIQHLVTVGMFVNDGEIIVRSAPITVETQAALNTKVDKVAGKSLSTNDFTTAEKDKLAAIESGAQINPTFRTINGNPITGTGGDIVITGGAGGAASASALTFTPTGNISATNVQSAITELDSEKANSTDVYSKTEIDALVIGNLTISTIYGGTF